MSIFILYADVGSYSGYSKCLVRAYADKGEAQTICAHLNALVHHLTGQMISFDIEYESRMEKWRLDNPVPAFSILAITDPEHEAWASYQNWDDANTEEADRCERELLAGLAIPDEMQKLLWVIKAVPILQIDTINTMVSEVTFDIEELEFRL